MPSFTKEQCSRIANFSIIDKTEDDLFRVLKRPDIHQMQKMYKAWENDYVFHFGDFPTTLNVKFCQYYGWTWREFLVVRKAHGYTY